MNSGSVYVWTPDSGRTFGGFLTRSVVPLPRLDPGGADGARLAGRFVRVHNAGEVTRRSGGVIHPVTVGDAAPDGQGNFIFDPTGGGPRVDRVERTKRLRRERYIETSRFGEVNTYYHLDRIGAYIDELLRELGSSSLPRVVAVVNAHHAATERHGVRDGVRKTTRWYPFQGAHYRLPARRHDIFEHAPICPTGEIHLGPGWRLLPHGALADLAGGKYRANASHNAGILYHEYGHHLTRHTADFRANALRPPERQNNTKTAMDEAFCDYWAAAMLGTPHIWALHHRHDDVVVHPRSLVSRKTMAHFDPASAADPHSNGTILASALWDVRTRLTAFEDDGARLADRLVLQSLLLLGRLTDGDPPTVAGVRAARERFGTGLWALLRADAILHSGQHRTEILEAFARRGISPDNVDLGHHLITGGIAQHSASRVAPDRHRPVPGFDALLHHIPASDIPPDHELATAESLESALAGQPGPPPSLIVVGDVMLGGRARGVTDGHGIDYPFAAVLPLLRRAPVVLANLEGPFARHARKQERNFSYRVNPALAMSLANAGINVVTLANNHLLDCSREGVVETLEILRRVKVTPIGAGLNSSAAHAPAIVEAGEYRIGLLGYYWNSRTAATATLPGSAMDPPEALEADITALKSSVDRVIATFHWGIPYEREPLPADREKARLAIDLGADVVVGHHPHVIQPFEVYKDRPIFYSVGNFAFGSGNSRAESLLLAVRFESRGTEVGVYPVYVKNRDPRVNYQPRVMLGASAERVLQRLAAMSGKDGERLDLRGGWGALRLPGAPVEPTSGAVAHV